MLTALYPTRNGLQQICVGLLSPFCLFHGAAFLGDPTLRSKPPPHRGFPRGPKDTVDLKCSASMRPQGPGPGLPGAWPGLVLPATWSSALASPDPASSSTSSSGRPGGRRSRAWAGLRPLEPPWLSIWMYPKFPTSPAGVPIMRSGVPGARDRTLAVPLPLEDPGQLSHSPTRPLIHSFIHSLVHSHKPLCQAHRRASPRPGTLCTVVQVVSCPRTPSLTLW